ncbi:MAG: HU family DNA-binding protein [Paracoccus sp. (in: a-proteobacteria)]
MMDVFDDDDDDVPAAGKGGGKNRDKGKGQGKGQGGRNKANQDKPARTEAVEINGELVTPKQFLERVASAGGLDKDQARAAVDVVLAVIADALDKGETLVIPPIGRLKPVKQRADKGGTIMTLRLRRQAGRD